jgi:hypothetical protein
MISHDWGHNEQMIPELHATASPSSSLVQQIPGGWRLQIPPGAAGSYRIAQLDDYAGKPRSAFVWRPPCGLEVQARSSSSGATPGTWGFGFWNDPFSLSLGLEGGTRRFPCLPNAAWFFIASHPNYLSFRDDLPAQGVLASTFRSPHLPALVLAASGILLPLLAIPPLGRAFRRLAGRIIEQDAVQLNINLAEQHLYRIDWQASAVSFVVDGQIVLQTPVSPLAPLGLVLWIDNQFAALPPDGRLRFGTLANPAEAWIEITGLSLKSQS